MRKTQLVNGEFYHIYNRGADKRAIFGDEYDIKRFFQSMDEFNILKPIGSIYRNNLLINKNLRRPTSQVPKLVNFICFCLNPNHYHFIMEQITDNGISEFMKRLGGGYTKYFNEKYKRSGVLFQGRFKSAHINSDEYLLHLSAYVNLNNHVHKLKGSKVQFIKSSWEEYVGRSQENFCKKDIILKQFNNSKEYIDFAKSSLENIIKRKEAMSDLLIETLDVSI
ncbi:MAG: hypothetical protein AVO34_01705 [Firmicutes bacterium ML8_F2]|jgi:putative transposase|nr:MAG: hypothetical protein AVO34_01705 [Firmicutes bacterium ML8_F2]